MDAASIVLYLVFNAFHIYIFFLAYRIFFGMPKINRSIEVLCYVAFYLLNSSAFIFVGNPFLNLATSVLPLFLLTILYNGNGRTKLLLSLFSYLASMLFELISFNLLQLLGMPATTQSAILGNLTAALTLFVVLLIYKQVRQEKKQRTLSIVHWVTIIILPAGSLVIGSFIYSEAVGIVATLIIITILILMNILTFYLYDRLDEYYFASYERQRLQQQNDAYLHELDIIKNSDKSIRMLRHDLKNHINIALQLLNRKEYQALEELFFDINGEYLASDNFVDTGNPELDSILNIKLNEADHLGADLDIDIAVPQQLSIATMDMNMILGNLLDNAIEAISISPLKKLKVHIYEDRGMLVLHIRNTFCGQRKTMTSASGISYQTQKQHPEFHGLGLQSVKCAVEKYDGDMVIQDMDGLFDANIIMYLP